MIHTKIAAEIQEDISSLRGRYLKALRECIPTGQPTPQLKKLCSQLSYGSEQISKDEQGILNHIKVTEMQETNAKETQQNSTDLGEAYEKLKESNIHLVKHYKENYMAKARFSLLQAQAGRLFRESSNIKTDLQTLEEYA
jgi:hypothetical protein